MNRVFLIGNLTKDPEVTTTSNDVTNCRFSVAVTRRYNSANGNKETDFFTVVTWRGLADNCGKYLRKGSKVGICGSIQNKNYEAADGTKRYSTEIVADEVQFLSSRNETEEVNELPEVSTARSARPELKPIEDDDLPF
ncbi:MAG: single-stranded DNA-binding protein [Clostridiales bacterium]|jgi:single-strand DNA-binding protein|nr:single-stranded DNA-binding protein [Clostridiales bacterium]MDY4655526.1 single-stranded DNA-binding protein [Eubacteriales bacterium]